MSVHFVYALATLNGVSISATQIVLSLYALSLGASPFHVGLLAATFSIFPALLAVTAGRLVDRFGSRWPMTFGAAGSGIGLLFPFFFPSLPAVYAAGVMSGLSTIFFNVSTQNLVGQFSSAENRARNFSNYALFTSLSNFLGPLVGGFLTEHASHHVACLYLSLLTAAPVAMLSARGGRLPGGTGRAMKGGGSVWAMLKDPAIRDTLIVGAFVNSGINLYQVYMPVYTHSIGLSASAIGAVLAMNSAAAFVVRFGLPRLIKDFGEARLLSYAFVMGAGGLALIPFFQSAVVLGLVSFIFGLGMGGVQPIVIMLMFTNSRDGRSGESLGLKFTTNQLTKLLNPIVFGAISSLTGVLPIFWINAALMGLGALLSRPKKE